MNLKMHLKVEKWKNSKLEGDLKIYQSEAKNK